MSLYFDVRNTACFGQENVSSYCSDNELAIVDQVPDFQVGKTRLLLRPRPLRPQSDLHLSDDLNDTCFERPEHGDDISTPPTFVSRWSHCKAHCFEDREEASSNDWIETNERDVLPLLCVDINQLSDDIAGSRIRLPIKRVHPDLDILSDVTCSTLSSRELLYGINDKSSPSPSLSKSALVLNGTQILK